MENLLEIKNLKTYFWTEEGINRAVDGIDFVVRQGETLGLVGESGCGKSVSALSILRLVPPPGRIVDGKIIFDGRNLMELDQEQMMKVRGKDIGMIFQEPMTSLNPVYSIESQVGECIQAHLRPQRSEIKGRVVELLRDVKIPSPEKFARSYPHQFSGGMRQRAMIAIAISCSPRLLIADEPTTALDVSIQAQILELFGELKAEHQMSILLITHDLGVIGEVADRVAVMYAGRIVETAPLDEIFQSPLHPYTEGLLECLPRLGAKKERFSVIPGSVPDPMDRPSGCTFHPRCRKASQRCKDSLPPSVELKKDHWVSCWEAEVE